MVGPLPVGQLEDAFLGKTVGTCVQCVECFPHLVDHVSPPLGALPVGAIKIGVAHGDVESAQCLLTVAVEKVIVALKSTGELAVVTGLAILEGENFKSSWYRVMHLVPVHPAEALVFLDTVASDVFCPDVWCTSPLVVVHADIDLLPCGAFDFQIRGDLGVVGQLGLDGFAVRDLG